MPALSRPWRRPPYRVAEQVERLAYHARRGEVWDKTVTYCQQAGARAHDRTAFREAVTSFEQALQALAHLSEPGDTRVLAIEIGLATLEGRDTPALVHCRLGHLYLAQGYLEHAIQVLEQGLALCRAFSSRSLLPSTAAGLGSAYALQGRLAEGRALLEEAMSEGIRIGSLQGYAHRVAWLSEVCRPGGTRR